MVFPLRQEFQVTPSPVGRDKEGWGEGPSGRTQNTSFSFFIGADRKRMEEGFLFLLLSYALTPALSQRERELPEILGATEIPCNPEI